MMITMLSGLKFTIGTEPTKLNQSYVRARCHLYNFKFLTLNLIETSDRTTAYQKRKQQLFRHRCLYLDRANKIEGTTSRNYLLYRDEFSSPRDAVASFFYSMSPFCWTTVIASLPTDTSGIF
ncbi:hypothetical protein BDR07DRAFT_1444759, partial [Suillus spraguei]